MRTRSDDRTIATEVCRGVIFSFIGADGCYDSQPSISVMLANRNLFQACSEPLARSLLFDRSGIDAGKLVLRHLAQGSMTVPS
jgi:hypothetical protein